MEKRALVNSNDMLNEVFSFLTGGIIVHRIALLSRRIREILAKHKDTVRSRSITLKVGPNLI
jgi:hypothetical protein